MSTMAYITKDEWEHISEQNRQAIVTAISRDRTDDEEFHIVELPNTFYVKYGKRLLDILIGGLACLVFSIVNLIVAVITFIDVGSPILYSQKRIGKGGKLFTLVKFRNMTNETNEDGILLPPEQRITRWGRFVRGTSIDELLNFWSVFKGDMSIIGPRPLPQKYADRFSKYHQQRHLVRPGLECPYHDSTLARMGWQGRLDNDVWYVEHISLKTDIMMAFLLVKKAFSPKERALSASGKTGEFIGYNKDGTIMNEWGVPRRYLAIISGADKEIKSA